MTVTCCSTKISPFVPRDSSRQHLDIAKINYMKERLSRQDGNIHSQHQQSFEETTKPGDGANDVEPNDTVAIAVGCVLAGLIVLVMISYFVIRRRANRK